MVAEPQKLDPYKAIIDARLAEFPRLSAQRLFDEIRAVGFPRSCLPCRAQAKGKAERPIRYIRDSFRYGRSSTSGYLAYAQTAHHWSASTISFARKF